MGQLLAPTQLWPDVSANFRPLEWEEMTESEQLDFIRSRICPGDAPTEPGPGFAWVSTRGR